MAIRRRGYVRWTPAAIPLGAVIMALGAWGFLVPLVGPYFNFDFFTTNDWSFSTRHWELLLGPGIVAFAGGLLMTFPKWGYGQLGTTLAIVGGVWFLLGPSLYPLWTSGQVELGVNHSEGWAALHWIGYFYGLGAVILYFAAFAQGMLSRRTVVERPLQSSPSPRSESSPTPISSDSHRTSPDIPGGSTSTAPTRPEPVEGSGRA